VDLRPLEAASCFRASGVAEVSVQRNMEPALRIESVWSYPRPPIVVSDHREVVVVHRGVTVASTTRAVRVLETSHPPTFYVPMADVAASVLRPNRETSFCEFKGRASYWDVVIGDSTSPSAAWSYPQPHPGYEDLADRVAFYPGRLDVCTVGGEVAVPQDGGFYGGWITPEVVGPFKGSAGTAGW
jgi:uncharacterized protein (DUF427 family)